jgi:hypothetical protein
MSDDLNPSTSLAEHEASAPVPAAADPPLETAAAPAAEGEAAASDSLEAHEESFAERDDQGRFRAPSRHRARSQKAGPGDVPRIAELTRRLRETEAENTRLKSAGSPPPAPAVSTPSPAVPSKPASAPPAAASFTPVPTAKDDPEPDQGTYDDYTKWVRDHNRWSAREEIRAANGRHTDWQRQQQTQSEVQRITRSWQERTTAAKAKYPDFQQVALDAPTAIPQGSLVDAWILEHKAGADVLYHLQKTPAELSRLLSLPLMEQVEELTLLAQRLSPNGRTAAAENGAAAVPIAQPVARPPTPIRTAPMRAAADLPGEDATLTDHEKAFSYKGRRR